MSNNTQTAANVAHVETSANAPQIVNVATAVKPTKQQQLDKKLADLASVANAINKAKATVEACLISLDMDKAQQSLDVSQIQLGKLETALTVKANKAIADKIQQMIDASKVAIADMAQKVTLIDKKAQEKIDAENKKSEEKKRQHDAVLSATTNNDDPIGVARLAAQNCRIPQFISLKKLGYALKIEGTVKTVNGVTFYVGKVWHKKAYLGLLTQDGFLVENEDDQYDSYMVEQLLPAITEITYPALFAKNEAREQKKALETAAKLEAARQFWARKGQ